MGPTHVIKATGLLLGNMSKNVHVCAPSELGAAPVPRGSLLHGCLPLLPFGQLFLMQVSWAQAKPQSCQHCLKAWFVPCFSLFSSAYMPSNIHPLCWALEDKVFRNGPNNTTAVRRSLCSYTMSSCR